MQHYNALLARLVEISRLNEALAVLSWDQQCYMPPGGALPRAMQLATIGKLAHEQFTDDATGTLLEAAEAEGHEPGSDAALCLRAVRRDFDQSVKLPAQLVADLARESALGHEVWVKARAESDYAAFSPTLSRLLDLSREMAERLEYTTEPYDALLNRFEPGATAHQVDILFADLREGIRPLLETIKNSPQADDSCLRRDFDDAGQIAFGEFVVRKLGFDFTHGRQDRAVHPFCTSFTRRDVRITTRVEKNWLPCALMGTIHEAGHGMYEQGFDPKDDDTPLSGAASLGFHESQSRLWENIIGRSRTFWQLFYPGLQRQFPETLGDVELATFYRAINRVEPSLIRVEADEVTYNLHIILRYEIERALISGTLAVEDVPEIWNEKMREYLGIVPENDAEGCLQDVHWSGAMFGYFPTYSIGTVLSSQLFGKALVDSPVIEHDLGHGEFSSLLTWLRENVHKPGRRHLPGELTLHVCGEPLNVKPYTRYLNDKYREIYFAERRARKRIL